MINVMISFFSLTLHPLINLFCLKGFQHQTINFIKIKILVYTNVGQFYFSWENYQIHFL
jgi:hypothetical protein